MRADSEALPLLAQCRRISVFKSSLHTQVVEGASDGAALDVVAYGEHGAWVHMFGLRAVNFALVDCIGAMLGTLDLFR